MVPFFRLYGLILKGVLIWSTSRFHLPSKLATKLFWLRKFDQSFFRQVRVPSDMVRFKTVKVWFPSIYPNAKNWKHSGSLQMGMLVLFKDAKNSTIMNCKSLIKVERYSFHHCASLRTFDLSDCCHLETIATECCENNASVTSSLASLLFPSSLKAIHWYVFQHEMNR